LSSELNYIYETIKKNYIKNTYKVIVAATKRIKKLTKKIINNTNDGKLGKFKFNNNKLINKNMRGTKS